MTCPSLLFVYELKVMTLVNSLPMIKKNVGYMILDKHININISKIEIAERGGCGERGKEKKERTLLRVGAKRLREISNNIQ